MARKALVVKAQRKPKFSTRKYSRCNNCGRPHSVYRKFGLCRICFREMALKGFIPGVKIAIKSKSSIKSKNHTLLILAWNFFNEIKKNNSDISNNFVNIKDLED